VKVLSASAPSAAATVSCYHESSFFIVSQLSRYQAETNHQHYIAVYQQALGESVIRKALEELQVWGLDRRFTLYSYSSTAGTK